MRFTQPSAAGLPSNLYVPSVSIAEVSVTWNLPSRVGMTVKSVTVLFSMISSNFKSRCGENRTLPASFGDRLACLGTCTPEKTQGREANLQPGPAFTAAGSYYAVAANALRGVSVTLTLL